MFMDKQKSHLKTRTIAKIATVALVLAVAACLAACSFGHDDENGSISRAPGPSAAPAIVSRPALPENREPTTAESASPVSERSSMPPVSTSGVSSENTGENSNDNTTTPTTGGTAGDPDGAGTTAGTVEAAPAGIPASQIPVLAYHSIMPTQYYHPVNVPNRYVLLDEVFHDQMKYLSDNGFTTLTAAQLIDFLYNNTALPEKPVVLTFDDGYVDNYFFAAPIMRRFGFVGMVFLITETVAEETPVMVHYPAQFTSFAAIQTASDVFEHGSHTHSMHRAVDGVPPLVTQSVENIRADIRQSFDLPISFIPGFAYPHGRSSNNAITALREEGVRFAFTTQEGYSERDTDPFLLPRFSVMSDWTMEQFIEIVSGNWTR